MSSNCLSIPSASAATSVASDGGGRLTKSWHLPLKSSSLLELLAAELDDVVLAMDIGLERVLRTAFFGMRFMLTSCSKMHKLISVYWDSICNILLNDFFHILLFQY